MEESDSGSTDRLTPEEVVERRLEMGDDVITLVGDDIDERDVAAFEREHEKEVETKTLAEHDSPFKQLFSPAGRVAILEQLISQSFPPGEKDALTVREMVERSDDLSTSSFARHKDLLLNYGVIEEAGKKGNAMQYRLNVAHPVAQLLAMLQNVVGWGRTPVYLEEQFIGHPFGLDEDEDKEPETDAD